LFLLLTLLNASLLVLLLALLFLFVFSDALFDIRLQVAALINGQLRQLEGHLVVVVALGKLRDDLDDALRLRLRQKLNLLYQVVALLNRQWLFVQVLV